MCVYAHESILRTDFMHWHADFVSVLQIILPCKQQTLLLAYFWPRIPLGLEKDHRSADGHNSQLLEFHLHFIMSSFLLHSCIVRVTSIALALLFMLPLMLMQRSVTHCACYVKTWWSTCNWTMYSTLRNVCCATHMGGLTNKLWTSNSG